MTYQNSVSFRRDLHELAELSNQEKKTSEYIAGKLREMGFNVKDHVGGYGVTVDIDSGLPGPTTMIRADMDALPYPDETIRKKRSLSMPAGMMLIAEFFSEPLRNSEIL